MSNLVSTIQKREKLNNVYRIGEKGNGGAYHTYAIDQNKEGQYGYDTLLTIKFQNGARKEENSVAGVIDSDLLEIVRDRLKSFQAGTFSSEYNAKALEHVEEALMWMNRRVEDRIERNVLGTNNK